MNGSRSSSLSFVLFRLVLAALPLALTACYRYTTFDVPGSSHTVPYGINNAGWVAGYFQDPKGLFHGFVRDSNGNITTIDFPDTYPGTYATDINNAGLVVGYFDLGADAPVWGSRGFLRDSSGNVTLFDFPNKHGAALGINDAGEVVGDIPVPIEPPPTAVAGFVLDPSGSSFTTFGFPGSSSTQAWGINNSGLIVGVFQDDTTGTSRGFFRDINGSFTAFDVPVGSSPGASSTRPTGVNDAGRIVGYFFTYGGGGTHGFLRYTDGSVSTIDVPDAIVTYVHAINDEGQLAGHFYDAMGGPHGFIATPCFFLSCLPKVVTFTNPPGFN